MPLNINGTVLQNTSGTLEAVVGSTKLFQYGNNGTLAKSSVNASFLTGNTTVGFIDIGVGWNEFLGWDYQYKVTPTSASYTNTGRYYAPVRGVYLFSITSYAKHTTGGYIHPGIWINGSSTRGTPANDHSHRIRGHGLAALAFYDINFSEIKFMEAGDYASTWFYAATGITASIHGGYSFFSGVLLG